MCVLDHLFLVGYAITVCHSICEKGTCVWLSGDNFVVKPGQKWVCKLLIFALYCRLNTLDIMNSLSH